MQMSKPFTIRITRTTDVEVTDESLRAAFAHVKEMYEGGDACAELGDATYDVVPPGSKIYNLSSGNLDMAGEEHLGTYGSFETALAAAQGTVDAIMNEDGLAADGYVQETVKNDDGSTAVIIQMPIANSDKMEDLEWWRVEEVELK
jgi:hypothetical protein